MSHTLQRVKKHFLEGTHRVRSPPETLEAVEPLMTVIGVEEVIDITHADRLGIPCFSAYRPRAVRGAARYHAGKGKDPVQAKVSAMMEAVERYSAEYRMDPMEFAAYEDLPVHRTLNPADIILPRPLTQGERIHWSRAHDLLSGEEVLVPSNAVFHPYDTMGMTSALFQSDTNGLASGNVREEAILHALLEVMERDDMSMAERNRCMGRRLVIDRACPAKEVQDRMESHGIEIHLWLLPGRTRVPTVAAAADDTVSKDPELLVMGSGTHPDPAIAALRALTEVAQSRASHLFGGRENPGRKSLVERAGYERMKRINREWFSRAEEVPVSSVEDLSTPYIDDDIRMVLSEIKPHAERVCVCDLTRTTIPVVRVIIPGLEVSHVNRDRVRKRTK
ncbi:MAG: YcaO-related McrA-glycine thioamidation protein [Methanoregulaceae archaeon]|jgi:ribosomal protein S12 methylthiotransferase accessory factor|nr:YcaO-related McrA-glycine thioamidation protein [Methanoregulaceae archaeon]MCU0629106.1 YcaO-related McrA-glycine thioamidation protein [Methanoregulaceae archaeon]